MEVDENNGKVYHITLDKQYTPTPDYSDYKESFASTSTPLIIDNGNTKEDSTWPKVKS